ncbi:MAG: protein phosphatase CheZ [Rhodospirillales bacterium]|nr:protein phosphatase CheZ [Rhodospirillales bacterium]
MSSPQQSYGREQVVQIINSVVSKIENVGGDATTTGIFKELKALQRVIEEARADIGLTRPTDIKDKHIPTATDELDAVVEATAEATGTIMDCCEIIQERASEASEDACDAINNEVIKIYEACSFQDITGQRITKVVSTLKTIEEKVGKLVEVLGERLPIEEGESGDEDDGKTIEERLLNGPQMPDKAITQDDIDKLLEDF